VRRVAAFVTVLFLALPISGPALGGKNVVEAEHERLSDEIDNLVQRQIWSGVERKYRELEKLETALTHADYLNGAYAARELGDVKATAKRLRRAVELHPSKELIAWLTDIDTNYGDVELLTVPARGAELTMTEMPFDPSQRQAVDTAVSMARASGEFRGLLPRGSYVFAGQEFTVRPGISVRIEVSPRMRRQGLIDPVIIYRDMPGSVTTTASETP